MSPLRRVVPAAGAAVALEALAPMPSAHAVTALGSNPGPLPSARTSPLSARRIARHARAAVRVARLGRRAVASGARR